MKKYLLLLLTISSIGAMAQNGLEGHWKGQLDVMGNVMKIVFHFEQDEEGNWSGNWDSPDQAAFGLPFDSLSIEGPKLYWTVTAMMLEFEGTMSDDGKELKGSLLQAGYAFPLTMERTENTLLRPQEPKPPFEYKVKEVSFTNTIDSVTLAGTLTYSKTARKYPAAILISGSGAQNRDEELLGHKPFLLLADNLTRAGIVVLRYDDRGFGESGGDLLGTTSDFARDTEAAIEYLKGLKQIDPERIYLIGHSEGGLIATMLAATNDDVRSVILLAGPAQRGDALLKEQSMSIALASGLDSAAAKRNQARQDLLFNALRIENETERKAALDAALDSSLALMSPQELMGIPEDWKESQIRELDYPWIRYFIQCDPMDYLPNMNATCLALFGELDLQVPAVPNADMMKTVFDERSANSDWKGKIVVYPGKNHLFQNAQTGLITEYYQIEETMDPDVIMEIIRWIKGNN
jgi:pimeloyl-ACP methyl ester carboxylesterase